MRVITYISALLLLTCYTANGQADYEIVEVSKLNSPFNEFSAKSAGDEILFCSNRKNDIVVSYLNEENEAPLTQIYSAKRSDFGKYTDRKQIEFSDGLKIDNGPFDFGPDSILYFSRSYPGDQGPVLGIFYAKLEDNTLGTPQPFEYNSASHMVGHPAFSHDKQHMYFSANFDDTSGRSDLYVCDWHNGKWTKPRNLGSEVNSAQSELFPFVHPDGTLYFSSNRSGGFGQLDIYSVTFEYGEAQAIQLLSDDFNSPANDFGFSVSADHSTGYFSSNRNGDDDLFEFRMVRPHFSDCDTLEKNSYCFLFFDAANISLDTLPLRYEWDFGDGVKRRNLKVEHCYSQPGTYQVALNIIDTLTGDLFFSQANYELEVSDIEQVYIEALDSVAIGNEVTLHGYNTNLPDFDPETYHWYFTDGSYSEGAEITHQFNELGTHTVTLGVRSQPDEKKVVQQACIQKQITVLDAGEYALMASTAQAIPAIEHESDLSNTSGIFEYLQNENDTVALDNKLPEETIYRVEIKQSKERLSTFDRFFDDVREAYDVYENFIPADSVYSYAIGQESALSNTYPIYTYVKSMNYSGANVKAYLPEHVYDLDELDMISEADLNRAVFRTGAIYFESDEAKMKETAEPVLDKILDLLNQFPSLQLEVGAHTDATGTAQHNQQLSNARAAAVIDYLVAAGIQPARLIGVGYGSEVPIGDNESEEGRKLNRRVEFKVVSTH